MTQHFWRVFVAITLAFLSVLASPAASAAEQDPAAIFTVPRVPVYAEANTAAAAQAQAQDQGRRVAMDLLLRRLTAEEDWAYLPRLAAGQPAAAGTAAPDMDGPFSEDLFGIVQVKQAVALSPEDLPRVETSFAPFDEKSSRTTYRAQITYRFKPEEVRRLLREARLPYSEAQTRRALVLPVLETEEGLYLWEAKNPWARAWLARPLVNELTPLVLPLGDERDVNTITATEARRHDADKLAELAERYGVGQVIVAHGKLAEEDGQFRLYVRLVDGYLDGRGANRRRIDAANSAELYDGPGYGADGRARLSAGRPGEVLAEAFFRGRDDDFPALAQRAVESTVARYAGDWKSRTLVDHSAVREFDLIAWFNGLEEWAEIRTALENSPLVKRADPGVFNNENAIVAVTAIGDEQQFILAMRQDNLTVWPGRDGWNIAEASLARRLQESLEPVDFVRPGGGGLGAVGSGAVRGGGLDDTLIDASSGVPGERHSDALVPTLPDDFGREEDGSGRGTILEQRGPAPLEPPAEATGEASEDELSIDDILMNDF